MQKKVQALGYLYNSEFMPFVVHVAPPPLDEFAQIESLRPNRRSLQDLAQVGDCFLATFNLAGRGL